MRITNREKIFLLEISRESIRSWMSSTGFRHEPDIQSIISLDRPEALENPNGVFIRLIMDDKIKFSMGKFNPMYPLYLVVRDLAILSTSPLKLNDINDIIIELSILTPKIKVLSIDDITLSQHGIHMVKDGKSGTFLPQVAIENNWTKEEFLGHLSQDVLGFEWDDWKTADLFMFESVCFNEKQFRLK